MERNEGLNPIVDVTFKSIRRRDIPVRTLRSRSDGVSSEQLTDLGTRGVAKSQGRPAANIGNDIVEGKTAGRSHIQPIKTRVWVARDQSVAWGEEIGLATVLATLDRLTTTEPDGTYAAVPLLRAAAGGAGFPR
jgi:hypothetical protein